MVHSGGSIERVSRRRALSMGGVLVATTGLGGGCGWLSTEPAGQSESAGGSGPAKGKEAPQLAEQAKSGDLPKVEDRMPAAPLVVKPADRLGGYGGTWSNPLEAPDSLGWLRRTIGYEGLVRWRSDWKGAPGTDDIIPNVAESFEANSNGTQYTFVLRRGMRWSDGEPFTADDVVFAQNDVLNDKDLYPVQKNNPTAEKIDDHTVRFAFRQPHGLFLQEQATLGGTILVGRPRHYLEKFHQKYNQGVGKLVEESGFSVWTDLFSDRADQWGNVDLPTLCAWMMTTPVASGQDAVAERNPYYWKTDPDGSQLPYIDTVEFKLVESAEVRLLNATEGQYGMYARDICGLHNKPVVAKGREGGGYDFFTTRRDNMNQLIVMVNLTHKDPVKRDLFLQKDFRVGLSHAINRDEIIQAAYQRQGEPWQVAPRPEDELYDEEMAKQYTDYDVALANEHLDKVAPEKNSAGIRMTESGEPIAFQLDFPADQVPEFPVVLDMIKRYWREVGIDLSMKSESYTLWAERIDTNDHDALIWFGDTGYSASILLQPRYFTAAGYNLFAVKWREWYDSAGGNGEKPPAPMRRQLELYDQVTATTDGEEQTKLLGELLAIAKEQFYTIGTVLPSEGYGIAKKNFHNVPDMVESWQYPTPAPTNPEQYFIRA